MHPIERARLEVEGLGDEVVERLLGANWVEVPGYTAKPDRESARDRSTRRHAVAEATEADLLVLWIDDRRGTLTADATFAADWDRWYVEHPTLERPPAIAVMITADRTRLDAARAVLPPTIAEVVALDPGLGTPLDQARALLPEIAAQLPRVERMAILRHLQRLSARSKAGRLVRQFGEQGKWIWDHFRRPRPGAAGPARRQAREDDEGLSRPIRCTRLGTAIARWTGHKAARTALGWLDGGAHRGDGDQRDR